jgi:geranylgeranyl diphosphate synthase type II
MRYSLLAGGKRLRPILCVAAAEAVGGKETQALPAACALECIHTYSLIHDDLPAMDDDDLRRGRPTSHKVFGEAMAILAGDALLTYAFQLLSDPALYEEQVKPEVMVEVIRFVADAAGAQGMVGGQVADVEAEGRHVDPAGLAYIHTHKTAALIRASVVSGALLGGGSSEEVEALARYGSAIGLAFQIVDDILDVIGDSESLGKAVGGDAAHDKATYPAVHGLEASRAEAEKLIKEACDALEPFGERGAPLEALALFVLERQR